MHKIDTKTICTRVEKAILSLANKFCQEPYKFFNESELTDYLIHRIANENDFKITTKDQFVTNLIHSEYNTFQKYNGKNKYEKPVSNGKTGQFDLTILNPNFVEKNNLETVINRNEKLRKKVRGNRNVLAAIELKSYLKGSDDVISQLNSKAEVTYKKKLDEILMDFRKLNHENISPAYVLIFNNTKEMPPEIFVELSNIAIEFKDINFLYVESYSDKSHLVKRGSIKGSWSSESENKIKKYLKQKLI